MAGLLLPKDASAIITSAHNGCTLLTGSLKCLILWNILSYVLALYLTSISGKRLFDDDDGDWTNRISCN